MPVAVTMCSQVISPLFVVISHSPPCFWVLPPFDERPAERGNGWHCAFLAPSRAAVDAFHAAALDAGGGDEGVPGLRPQYSETYYGAYVRDADGNKIAFYQFG